MWVLLYNLLLLIIIRFILKISIRLFMNIKKKSDDILQYKISSLFKDCSIIILYVLFSIVFLYILRIYNIPRSIDLRVYLNYIYIIGNIIYDNLLISIMPLLVICSFILMFVLSLMNIHKYFTNKLYRLYLYYFYPWDTLIYNNPYRYRFHKFLKDVAQQDFIQYSITKILYKIILYIDGLQNRDLYDFKKPYPWYRLDVYIDKLFGRITWHWFYYKYFFQMTPFLIIIYDCIFNNFVITHIFYYMLLYIPLMLFKKGTTCVINTSWIFCSFLWKIYYEQETCIYAVSSKDLNLFKLYLHSLKNDIDLGLDAETYLQECIRFIPHTDNNNNVIYYNNLGNMLRFDNDGILYEVYAEDSIDTISKSNITWILLLKKEKTNNLTDVD